MKKIVLSIACLFGSLLTSAQTGAALNFSGSGDFVQLTDPNFGTSDFTLETWIKPNATGGAYLISTRTNEFGGAGNWFVLSHTAGKIGMELADAGFGSAYFETPTTPVTLSTWNHVALVRSGLQFSIYVNGILSASYTDTGLRNFNTGANSIRLSGWANVGVAFFNGMMDETRFWNVARTPCQIYGFMNSEIPTISAGLIGNYHFNQGIAAGTNGGVTSLTDNSGSSRTGTLNNFALTGATSNWITPGGVVSGYTLTSPVVTANSGVISSGSSFTISPSGGVSYTYTPSGPVVTPTVSSSYTVIGAAANGCTNTAVSTVSLQAGEALSFDGANDYVALGNVITQTNSYTKEAWIYANSSSSNNIISSTNSPFWLAGNKLSAAHAWGSGFQLSDPANFPLNVWTHVAVTYNKANNKMILYKNGVAVATSSITPAYIVENIEIGAYIHDNNNNFNGKMDEVRIWNRVLCQSEIQSGMNAELPAGQIELMGYYKMNQGVASAANPGVIALSDASGNGNAGALTNFALTGGTSNWIAPGTIIVGSLAPVFASPVVSIAGVSTICPGIATTFTASGATTYNWISGPTTSTLAITPTVTTTYSVIGSNAAGCTSGTIVKTLAVNATPTVSVTSGVICSGNSFTMAPTGASTYTYSSGSAVVSPTTNTSYNVTGTSSLGCVSSNTAVSTVTVNVLPIISVNSGAICAGQSFTMIPTGAVTFTYSNGTDVVTPTADATYSVSGTDANGCVSNVDVVSSVTVNTLPTITVNSGAICAGQSFTMVPIGAVSYTYSNGSDLVTPTSDATYSVSGTDANGCVSNVDAISSVTVNVLPIISVNSGAICSGQSFTMVPSGATTYTYSNGTDIVTPTSDATYSVSGTDANGCVSSFDAISSVTVNVLPTISVNSGAICAGQSFTMVPTGAVSYTYSNGTDIVMPTADATYSISGTDANGCISSVDAVSSLTVNALPIISVNSGAICAGQSFTMVPTGATTYTYSNGTDIVMPAADATYSVSGTDANGCISNLYAVSSVTVNALPVLTASTTNTLLCTGETATLSVSGATSYTWSTTDNTSGIVVTPTAQTTYTVDGIDANGCANSTTIMQDVSLCTGIVTLNAIEASLISVYPNPNNGLFTVDLVSTSKVIVTNALGQIVIAETMESGKHNLDIHNQSTGIYFVKVILDGKQHVIKLIKE